MHKKRTNSLLKRITRRVFACSLVVLALWMLALATPGSQNLFTRWGSSARLVTAALAAQLHIAPPPADQSTLSSLDRLLLSESALLHGWASADSSTAEAEESENSPMESNPDADEVPSHATGEVVERFFQPLATEAYAQLEGIYILNRTAKELDMAALASASLNITLNQEQAPQILIMHTHGSEAYAPDGDDQYEETDTARTTDTNYNTIRVGDEIARIFTEMGLSVIHDRELYDYPSYNGSYDRSREAVERYLAEYPSIQIVLDVHRDALVGEDGTVYKAVTEVDGQKTAQVLLVMGSDDGGLSHPNWDKNLGLAMRIQHRMSTLWPGLARPMNLRSSRFNQQLTQGSLLVEIGSHGNTLQEALAGARLFARSAGQVFLELTE